MEPYKFLYSTLPLNCILISKRFANRTEENQVRLKVQNPSVKVRYVVWVGE